MTHFHRMTFPWEFQCPPHPPQFGHLQFGAPSKHSSNEGVAGRGNTDGGRFYILLSTCGQVRERVSYTPGAKGSTAFRVHLRQGLCGYPKLGIRAKTCEKQDSYSSR